MLVTGADNGDKDGNIFAQRLDKMVQMTGLADPVYVEVNFYKIEI